MKHERVTLVLSQANYQFSPFVAEMANSFSNVVTIFLGLYGAYVALQQKLPTRYPLGFLVCFVFFASPGPRPSIGGSI